MKFSRECRGFAAAVLVMSASAAVAAQSGAITGQVTRDTGEPMAGAAVELEELDREVRTEEDGSYRFDAIPPGRYHVSVHADGYSTRRTEVDVASGAVRLDLVVELDLHFAEVVSVSPTARSAFESYQPTSVLAGQELQKQLESTIGATLQSEPGLAMRSLGPGPARPVIRGLDGDRVAVLQDGQRVGDLSSQSGDHGVTVNPSAARQIEVVRGPATLLYGANAIGGLVNVITDQIPTASVDRATGELTLDAGSNASDMGAAGDVHFGNGRVAVHAGGSSRRAGEFATPDGRVANSQSRTSTVNVGASWTGDRVYAGASYGLDDSEYGVPLIEEGQIRLTPRRHAVTFRTGGERLDGVFSSYRATLGLRRYAHQELHGGEIGTRFDNDTEEAELLVSHRPYGRLSGTVGGSFFNRRFAATGDEALSPPVHQRSAAVFLYEELTWAHATVQFGGRFERTSFDPSSTVLPGRVFNEFSGSFGLLLTPPAAGDRLVLAISLARAARNPALEELYFYGPHPGNFAFEIGNARLSSERAIGADVSVRARSERARGEVTFFYNHIGGFIFRNPIAEPEFLAREEEIERQFGVTGTPGGHDHDDGLQFVEFVGADSRLFGIEAHADVNLTSRIVAELTYDWVRGELLETREPLPRIPPFRVIPGLRFQHNAFQAGGSVTLVADQTRVFGVETPTPGAALLKLYGAYSFARGAVTHTVTARVDNATDARYRNHLNYLKDLLPEMGRSVKLIYSMAF